MRSRLRNLLTRNGKLILGLCALGLTSMAKAQPPTYTPMGYDFLGRCGTHEYYISQAYVSGLNISTTVTDFRTKTGLGPNAAYAAAIVNQAENDCVRDMMLAYNGSKYGVVPPTPGAPYYNNLAAGAKSRFPDWGDPRNPWIGLTDAQVEGSFVWSNGQPDCEDFRFWNKGEPNNYVGNISNGEDFTQMLIMSPYFYDASFPNWDPVGRWNDWFNNLILKPGGGDLGTTTLPLIIEVGPADCQVNRGNLGCSHGYWKNADDKAWNEVGGLSRQAKFSVVFGITNGRNVITISTGPSNGTTMQQALELKGGGYNQVAKQGVAALMNANAGIAPYTSAEIKAAVQSMFNNGTASLPAITVNGKNYTGGTWNDATSFASYLDYLNNLGCPLNNHGDFTSSSSSRQPVDALNAPASKAFAISGYPNPSRSSFSLQIDGAANQDVTVKVTDATGRLVEQRTNIAANQVLQIGNTYKAGLYYVEVTQGAERKQAKLVKQ